MIDLNKHAREIGRHLRNRNYELSEGGVLIKGGMNALVNGAFKDTLYRDGGADAGMSPNLVVNQGLVHVLNAAFGLVAPITAWYVGLFSGNVTPQATWTGANIVAQATEVLGYAGARPNFDVAATTTPSIGNSGSEANFAFAASGGPYTARGAFIVSASAKGATTGVLLAATRFAADRSGLASPDQLGVQYTLTAADAG